MRSIAILFLFVSFLAGCQRDGQSDNSNLAGIKTPRGLEPVLTNQAATITSPDGANLVGTFFGSAKPNSPALLLLHQWQSDRHSYDDFAKRMQEEGFNVLAIDGRGFGQSVKTTDGKTVSAGRSDDDVKLMLGDVRAACDFLAKQKDVDPTRIGIVGASYGSSLAIIYGADDPKVKAIALLSPGLNYFGNMPTEPAVERFRNRPLYLIAAEDDQESADSVRKLSTHGAIDGKWQVTIFKKGGHGTGLFVAKVGLEDLLKEFFLKAL